MLFNIQTQFIIKSPSLFVISSVTSTLLVAFPFLSLFTQTSIPVLPISSPSTTKTTYMYCNLLFYINIIQILKILLPNPSLFILPTSQFYYLFYCNFTPFQHSSYPLPSKITIYFHTSLLFIYLIFVCIYNLLGCLFYL